MVKIKKQLTIKYVEKLYTDMYSSKEGFDLTIPAELKEVSFFSMTAFIQFIVTWIRKESSDIFFDVELGNETEENTFKQYSWFLISSLIWRSKGVKNLHGESLKDKMRITNEHIHRLMSAGKKIKGNSLLLASFDDLPRNRGLLKIFYNNKNELYPEANVEQYIFTVFKDLGEFYNKRMFSKLSNSVKEVSAIIYELYKNTDQWAVTDFNGDFLQNSVRAVYFKVHRNEPQKFSELSEGNPLLKRYLSHSQFEADDVGRISFLEISVSDSGKGYVGKLIGDIDEANLSVNDEVQWVKKCLTKNFTLEEGKNKDTKGIGLDRVLKLLDKKGFLRIRTNKVSLCRDLITNNYQEENSPDKIKLFDWTTGNNLAFTVMPQCEGSVLSIILPL